MERTSAAAPGCAGCHAILSDDCHWVMWMQMQRVKAGKDGERFILDQD